MKIRLLEECEYAAYDELACRYGTLFNRSDWLALFGDQMQILGVFEDGGQMVGGFSLYHERRLGIKIFRRAPFTPTCGPFFEMKAQNPVAVLEYRRKILKCMVEYLERQRYGIVMLSLDRRIKDALPFFWRGYKVIPNYTYNLDLSIPIDQMLKNMSSDRRKSLSKGKKDGLTVRATTDLSVVRDLVLATFGRQQKAVDREILNAIIFRYAKPVNSFAFTTYREDKPIAASFVVHDERTAYYLMGGYDSENSHHGAGPMAMMASIEHAKKIGLKTYDFEGSVIPPIEKYFRGFGGQLKPFFTVNKAWFPLEIALKFRNRNRF